MRARLSARPSRATSRSSLASWLPRRGKLARIYRAFVTHPCAAGGAPRAAKAAQMPTTRIEAFSDAVIAVAITLLVLDIKVPDVTSTHALWHSLGHLWPNY